MEVSSGMFDNLRKNRILRFLIRKFPYLRELSNSHERSCRAAFDFRDVKSPGAVCYFYFCRLHEILNGTDLEIWRMCIDSPF